ncbi:MAG: hypothetical protein U1G07_20135 [Verrucomicrobiota bacterium]
MPGLIQLALEQHLVWWTGWRYNERDEDRGWDWWGIYRECSELAGRYECYAAAAAHVLQGLMVLDLQGRTTNDSKAVVVDYLATKPANRASTSGLKYVGIALLALAIERSIEIGAGGRIWLESLAGAASFYESLGMNRQPRRSAEGNLVYLLNSTVAKQLLERIKENRIVEP